MELTRGTWTEKMEAEEQHMKTKRARRLVEVVAAGGNPNPRLLGGMSVEEIVQIYRADQERLASDRMKKLYRSVIRFAPGSCTT